MKNYCYYIKIASLIIEINSPVKIAFQPRMLPFCIATTEKSDLIYKIEWETEKDYTEPSLLKDNFSVLNKDGQYMRKKTLYVKEQTYTIFLKATGIEKKYCLVVPKEIVENHRLFTRSNILNFLALEEGLLSYNAFILHSSFISWRGSGIVFTAPSGTGKSTQADLWHEYEGAEIYNGDRTIIRRIDNVYHGFGSPYAGSSGIYRNETAPIKAIIVLTQAPENRIERLNGKQAFLPLYKETLMNTWNPEYMSAMTDLLMDAAAKIPIYHLACRPDKEAVELVKITLFQEE